MRLNPKVFVSEIAEMASTIKSDIERFDPPLIVISVHHPFIFDKRLIPDEFQGVEVRKVLDGNHPKEFPSNNAELPMEDWYAPERYIKFVENNLSIISKKLNIPDLTREEALDALTGDFKLHIDLCVDLRKQKIEEEKDNMAVFTELLYEIKQVYLLSDVYKKSKKNQWYYALSATRLAKNTPLILGFNWGVDSKLAEKGLCASPQTEYPFTYFDGLYDELGSFKKVVDKFHDYYTEGLSGVQTNYCFFRSPKEDDISAKDIEICEPIFDKLIKYLEPASIITFSKKLHRHLMNRENQVITEGIPSGDKTVYVSKGTIKINDSSIKYYNLPHPNNWHYNTSESIEKAWGYCFREK